MVVLRMNVVVEVENVLHHAKREDKFSGRGNVWRNMSRRNMWMLLS